MENFQDMEGLVQKRAETHVEIQDMDFFSGYGNYPGYVSLT